MTSDEFKTSALSTEKVPTALHFSRSGLAMLLSAAGQMAGIVDQVKKTMIYDKPFSENDFREKIGKLTGQLERMVSAAHRIAIPEDTESPLHAPNLRLVHGSIGMYGEAGELLEAMLKQLQTGELDMVNVGEELGDAFWYATLVSDESGISFEMAQEAVIQKLTNKQTGRYKAGYSNEAALNRDIDAERALLESSVVSTEAEAALS